MMGGQVMTGAQAIVRCLADAGVKHVFGLPGDTGVDLYDALASDRSGIRHVLSRDERHAVTMADVYARCTNEVGVVEVSSGGGVSFSIGGLGEPYAASVPLLVIASDIHSGSRDTGALTEIDQVQLFTAVTKWRTRVESAADLPAAIATALEQATTGRPAPVAVIVPEEILGEKLEFDGARSRTSVQLPAVRVSPEADRVRETARALAGADRPAIVVGGGIHASAGYTQLAALAKAGGIPVATTIQGKGAIAEADPLSLGVVGANGARPYANTYLADADVVLFVGTRSNATDTNGFRSPPRSAHVAQIDIDGERAGRNYPGSIPLVGDAATALADITSALPTVDADRGDRAMAWIADQRAAWRSSIERSVSPGTVHPLDVFDLVVEAFGDEVLLVSDCGTPTPFLGSSWEVKRTGRDLIVARGHGPMGYAIPGGIGAAFARPEQPIVVITTDGSLGMACGELETVARLGLAITFVQLTNGSYGWIKMLQHLYHAERYFGVDIGRMDAAAIAGGFGVQGVSVTTTADLRAALTEAADAHAPRYVDVAIPDEISCPPPVAPWTTALSGGDASRPVY